MNWKITNKSALPFLLGILVTPIFAAVSIVFTAGGDGTYVFALGLFPWAMLISVLSSYVTVVALSVGAIQWPLYGLLASTLPWAPKMKVAVLVVLHVLMIVLVIGLDRGHLLRLAWPSLS